jgi:hypothetical protein
MKKLTLLLAFIVSAAAFTPIAAEARDRHRHHHDSRRVAYHCRSCGDSIYQQRYYAGRDRYGRPIYTWRNVSHRCRSHHHHYHGGDRNRWHRTGGSIHFRW